MNKSKSYAAAQALDEVMIGGTAGERAAENSRMTTSSGQPGHHMRRHARKRVLSI
jgi:hypothetical protein